MNFLVKIILLVLIFAHSEAVHVEKKNTDIIVDTPSGTPVDMPISSERKPKQYLQFDGAQPQPVQQPGLAQLPIIGTLVGNLPGLVGGLPGQLGSTIGGLLPGQLGVLVGGLPGQLGGLVGGFPGQLGGLVGGLPGQVGGLVGGLPAGLGTTLGSLTQGLGLQNLGLGGLLNLGGQPGGTASGLTCPVTQKLNCKCEPLVPVKPLVRKSGGLEILQHTEHSNEDGTTELSAILSNGLTLYQRSGIEKDANNQELPTTQGYYSLKLKEQRYLTIYFVINDLDYTVKANVSTEPPKTDVVGKQIGSFV